MRDNLGQVWILTVIETLVATVRSTPKGTEIERFLIIPNSPSLAHHVIYDVRGKAVGKEGSPVVARKALDRLAELLAPVRKLRKQ